MLGWTKSWNTIIREVFWKDALFKKLIEVPSKANILQFRDKYFIRAGFTTELLTDEACRVVYSDSQGVDTNVPNVRRNIMTFDVYVKETEQYNVGDDRLISRADLIVNRINYLLTKDRYVANTGYRFWIAGDWDLGTRTIGYARKTIAFYYMKVY